MLSNLRSLLPVKPARRDRKSFGPAAALENLESREMMSVNALWFSGNTLVVRSDNVATNVSVHQVGGSIQIRDVGTNRSWSYSAAAVGSVEFQGGAGNDRFVNYAANLPVRAFGYGGHDYLEGYNGNDVFVGGDGNDTMVGYGGNDAMWGGNGDDTFRGMAGNDSLVGGYGNDHIDGGDGVDSMWGEYGDDVLLGQAGDDWLMGGDGNDRLNGGAGLDRMWGGNGDDVLVGIDGGYSDLMQGDAGRDTLWADRFLWIGDSVYGQTSADLTQNVTSFSNGADRTLNGDRIVDPAVKSGQAYRTFSGNQLFSASGPQLTDIRQGGLGDCYFLAGLGAIAIDNSHALRQNIADFDDGTYGVRLGNSFYRVDNDLPVNVGGTTTAYAALGAGNSMWVAIYEKAFAHYRTGANTYASIESGWAVEVNRAFRSTSAGATTISAYASATALANDVANRWNTFQAVTIGFWGQTNNTTTPLVMGHMYTVAGIIRNAAGVVTGIRLRNPWGTDGAGNDGNNDGFVTVSAAQIRQFGGQVNYGRV